VIITLNKKDLPQTHGSDSLQLKQGKQW